MLHRLSEGEEHLEVFHRSLGFVVTSMVAFPLYLVILPLDYLDGFHWFMRYCIRLCDHAGRLLALAGLNPVSEREV